VGDLDRDQIARDLEPAIPEGGFDKVSLELVRKQLLPGDLQASFRYLRQSTGRNLDSSEDFLLGGPSGVRSYPTGEAAGDTGWLGQLELSKRLSAFFTPYVFYDEGRSRAAVSQNVRQRRSGYGLGLKYADKGFSSDVLVGWQQTGRAQSDPLANHYMVWATASYQF
jgi:hemolysin activation/secretion protein